MKNWERAWKWGLPVLVGVVTLTLGCSTGPMGEGLRSEAEIVRLRSQNVKIVRENARLSGENSAMQAQVAQLQKQIRALEKKIDRLLAEATRKRPASFMGQAEAGPRSRAPLRCQFERTSTVTAIWPSTPTGRSGEGMKVWGGLCRPLLASS